MRWNTNVTLQSRISSTSCNQRHEETHQVRSSPGIRSKEPDGFVPVDEEMRKQKVANRHDGDVKVLRKNPEQRRQRRSRRAGRIAHKLEANPRASSENESANVETRMTAGA